MFATRKRLASELDPKTSVFAAPVEKRQRRRPVLSEEQARALATLADPITEEEDDSEDPWMKTRLICDSLLAPTATKLDIFLSNVKTAYISLVRSAILKERRLSRHFSRRVPHCTYGDCTGEIFAYLLCVKHKNAARYALSQQ